MNLLAIDPGSEQSAWLVYDLEERKPLAWDKEENESILDQIQDWEDDLLYWPGVGLVEHVAIETLHPRGMPTSIEEMQTQFWAGRFVQAIGLPFTQIDRKDEKMTLCGRCAKVTDANIRAALIDLFGGKDAALGKKKSPGVLYGMSGDCWQALAIAICWQEMHAREAAPA